MNDFVFNGVIANENGIIQFQNSESVMCQIKRNGILENIALDKVLCIERGYIGENEWIEHWLNFVDGENAAHEALAYVL